MIGDQADFAGRIRAVLPQGWFPTGVLPKPATIIFDPIIVGSGFLEDSFGNQIVAVVDQPEIISTAPVLYSVLSGFSVALAGSYALIQLSGEETLISTATDIWLDLHAQDFLGNSVLRRAQESDASFRTRMQAAIFPPAVTRQALIDRLTLLTGRAPVVFEPTQPIDTGAYGYGGLGYNTSGGYGSLALPFQAFVTVFRPHSQGVPLLAGYSGDLSSPVYAPLGYGTGLGSYVDIAQAFDGVTDADIYHAVAATEAAGSIVWTRISS